MQVSINGKPHQLESAADEYPLAALLDDLQMSGRPVAVEVNLQLVPRERFDETLIHGGDSLEIVTLAGGG